MESLIPEVGLIIALLPIIISVYKFMVKKNLEQNDLRFKKYHLLIKNLVEPEDGKDYMMLDRQIAICFELRKFPEYFEVTQRIIKGLYEDKRWNDVRIKTEIECTLKYIKIYNKTLFFCLRSIGLKPLSDKIVDAKMNRYNDKLHN